MIAALLLTILQVGPLTLERAIDLAVRANEAALVADQQREAAEGRLARARAAYFPDLTVSGNYTRRAFETEREVGGERVTIQSRNALSATGSLAVPLFDARTFPLYRQARLERDAAQLSAAEARRLVAFDAAAAYLTVLGAEQVVAAAQRRLELAAETLAQTEERHKAGLVGSNDVTRAELERVSAERDRARVQGDLERARLGLELVVAAPVPGNLAEPEALLGQAARAASGAGALLAQGARERRLDLAAARRRAGALEAAAAEPTARAVPSLGALAQVRATNEGGLQNRNVDGFAGVTLTWLLWDGGERSAEARERRALAAASVLDAQALGRRVEREVRDALVALRTGQEAERQAEAAAAAARKNSRETGELYRQGLAPALAVADANLRLFEAEVERIRTRYGVAQAYLALRLAVGLEPLGRAS